MPSANPPKVDYEAGTQAALRARRARAQIKADIRSGARSPLDVVAVALADKGSDEASLRITDFLKSLSAVGEVKSQAVLESLGISPRKRLGFLGLQQQKALRAYLRSREGGSDGVRPLCPVVLAGPSGVGKGTVAAGVRGLRPDTFVSISVTTRRPRPGEIDGEHYFFISDHEFDRLEQDGELLEWAEVHGQYRYGTPRRPVEDAIEAGRPVMLEIDVQGALQVKRAMPNMRLVFLLPPTWDDLVSRLASRATESPQEQERRLQTARDEFALVDVFDVAVINDDVNAAARMVLDLMGVSQE